MAETIFHKPLDQEVASINAHLGSLIQTDTFTADSTGFISISADNYMVISAYASGYVLLPYIRPGSTNWALRKLDDTAYSGTCVVTYCEK